MGDETRIVAALETLRWLHQRGAKTVILSHLGRPDGTFNSKYSLRPVAARLAERVATPVEFVDDCIGPAAVAASHALPDGGFVLLRKRPLSSGRGEQRPGVRARARAERRSLRQRRVRYRASRARLHRRRRERSAGLRRTADGSRTGRAHQADRRSGEAVRVRDRRREGGRQGRRVRELAHARQFVRDRRRDGQHVPRRAGRRRREIAARSGPRPGPSDRRACEDGRRRAASADRRRRGRCVRCRRNRDDGSAGGRRPAHDPRYRAADGASVRGGAARGQDDRLQRADGRLRKSAVPERHARRGRSDRRRPRAPARSASSAAATRPRPQPSWGSPGR